MSTHRDPILFISGAGLGPWVWEEVRDLLDVGTRVASRPSEGTSATLAQYAEAAIQSAPHGQFTVVAHSVGGMVAAEVARLAPDRVSGVLAVTATIAGLGQSFTSARPIPQRWLLATAMRVAGTRPPEKVIRRGLGEGLADGAVQRIVAEFVTESRRLYTDPTSASSWPGRRGYIVTTRDREIPPSRQRQFAQRLNPTWQDHIETGHLPMVEDPSALAASIVRFMAA